jgi:NAD(P)-dependent dehydrogenase (short-subunit alcohol dehydrogenase family)
MDLNNKNVVIVGASSGLGKALAELLSKENVKLFLLSRKIGALNIPDAIKIPTDIKNPESVQSAFEQIDNQTDSIDLLINCAGIGLMKDLRDTTVDEINAVIDTDLKGAIFVSQESFKRMSNKKSGHIINIISTSGKKPRKLEPIYAAAKFGLSGFTQSLQLAGEETGVKVSENFWKNNPEININEFMDPATVAEKIIDFVKGEYQKELIIERPVAI